MFKFFKARAGFLFNLRLSLTHLFAMFMFPTLYDGAGGAASGTAAPPAGNPPAQKKSLTMDDIKTIVSDIVKTSSTEEIKKLQTEIAELSRKQIFSTGDGDFGEGMAKSENGSVINTKVFNKFFGFNNPMISNKELGKQLSISGGPWVELSQEMKTFVQMACCGFNANSLALKGIDLKGYNEKVRAQYKAAGMNEGVVADGLATVPIEFAQTIIEFAVAQSQLIGRVMRLPMSSNILKIPKLAQAAGNYFGGITLKWKDEGEQNDSSKARLEQLTFTANKLTGLFYITEELAMDSAINIANYMTALFTRALMWETERVIIAGSGDGQPLGIVNDPTIAEVARKTAGKVKYDDFVNLDAAIDENFRDLVWLSRKATLASVRLEKDLNGRPIVNEDYASYMGQRNLPPTIMGYPTIATRNVPVLGKRGDIICCDPSTYILTVRQDISISMSEHVRFEFGEIGYRFVMRMDGKPGISAGAAVLDDATS